MAENKNSNVTLMLGGKQVFPRTFAQNVIHIEGEKQVTIAQVLDEIKGAQSAHTSLLGEHAAKLSGLEVEVLSAKSRLDSAEGRLNSAEGRISANEKTLESHGNRITANEAAIKNIQDVIPAEASASNKLMDERAVNDKINQIAASYITSDEAGTPFATKEALVNATVFYSGGEVVSPSANDYTIVLADESVEEDLELDLNGRAPSTRYIFNNEQWELQYIINTSPFTAAQMDAIDSGINAELVGKITANESAIGELTQTVTNNKSEIDERLDSAEDRLDAIDGEEGRLATIESAAAELAQTVANNKKDLDERIDDIVNSNLGGLDREIAEINSNITALQQEINGVPADPEVEGSEAVVGIKDRLTTAEGAIDAAEGRLDAAEGRLDAIDGEEGRLATIESNASALEGRVETAEGDIDALEGRMETAEGDIDALEGRATDVEGRLDSVEGRMETTEGDIDSVEAAVAAIRVELDGVPADDEGNGAVVGIYGRLDGHDTSIQELREEIASKQADLTAGQYVTIETDESGSQVIDVIVDTTLALDSTNPIANSVVKTELDKKIECEYVSDADDLILDDATTNALSRIATLEMQVAALLTEVEVLKALHNGNGNVSGSAPESAPILERLTNGEISFQEVEGATGYNVYVNGKYETQV